MLTLEGVVAGGGDYRSVLRTTWNRRYQLLPTWPFSCCLNILRSPYPDNDGLFTLSNKVANDFPSCHQQSTIIILGHQIMMLIKK